MRIYGAMWDGRPAEVHAGTVVVGPNVPSGWWCYPLIGKRIACVRIVQDGYTRHILDDEGQGVAKVLGGGGFTLGHKDIPADRDTFQALKSPAIAGAGGEGVEP